MELRRDALAAAAEWITQVEAIAARCENLVATVGQMAVEPGAVNVIAGVVHCSLDVRHAQDVVRADAVQAMFETARSIGRRRNIGVETDEYHQNAAVKFDTGLVAHAEQAIRKAGVAPLRMISGAGHDAMVIAPHLPSAMIFLRNPGGISHHPDESVAESDVAAALHAGLCFITSFDGWLAGRRTNRREAIESA